MKINEFIKKVNRNDRMEAEEVDGVITIYNDSDHEVIDIPNGATNLLEINFIESYSRYSFGKPSREYLSALIEEFLHTPIEDRFPEKEWYLCIGVNSKGHKVYLVRDYDAREIVTNINKDCMSPFTDRQVEELKKEFPKLAPAIDAMKEPVEDDNDNINAR